MLHKTCFTAVIVILVAMGFPSSQAQALASVSKTSISSNQAVKKALPCVDDLSKAGSDIFEKIDTAYSAPNRIDKPYRLSSALLILQAFNLPEFN